MGRRPAEPTTNLIKALHLHKFFSKLHSKKITKSHICVRRNSCPKKCVWIAIIQRHPACSVSLNSWINFYISSIVKIRFFIDLHRWQLIDYNKLTELRTQSRKCYKYFCLCLPCLVCEFGQQTKISIAIVEQKCKKIVSGDGLNLVSTVKNVWGEVCMEQNVWSTDL